jgi:hypothetical protein
MPSALFTLAYMPYMHIYTYNDGIGKEKSITLIEVHVGIQV